MPGPIRVLYEDNHLLGVYKPARILVQGDRTGDVTLFEMAKTYLKTEYSKPGNVFLGLVHRLDRPVSGVVLFARTSKAASRLSNEFRLRRAQKTYFAVVVGRVAMASGELAAYVERAHLRSRLAPEPGSRAKEAKLQFSVLDVVRGLSLLEITPSTGRHHQIRVQLAAFGHPVVGDVKYGAKDALDDQSIALHAGVLRVKHPTQDREVTLAAPPPPTHPWTLFQTTIDSRFGSDE